MNEQNALWEDIASRRGRHYPAHKFIAEKFHKQGSGMISSVAYSDGIVEIPEKVSSIKLGQVYDYYDFKILFP